MLLSLVALVCLQAPTWTDGAVLRAECVVVGKVERIFEAAEPARVTRPPRVALVAVSEVLMGPAQLEPVLVLDRVALPGMEGLAVGREAVWFLGRVRSDDKELSARLEPVLRSAPQHELMTVGEDLVRVEGSPWLLPPGLVRDLGAARRAARPEDVRAELEASLARVLPSLEARYVSSGPRNWSLRFDARGTFEVDGKAQPPLEPDAHAALVRALGRLEPETMLDMPLMGYPCASWCTLEVRARNGVQRVKMYLGQPEASATEEQRAVVTRFREFWKLLPGAGKPELGS